MSFECKFDLCDRDLCVTQRLLERKKSHSFIIEEFSQWTGMFSSWDFEATIYFRKWKNVRGICVFLKWFITTTVVQATSLTRPFSVEERAHPLLGGEKPWKRGYCARCFWMRQNIRLSQFTTWETMSERFLLLHDTQVRKVALCSVRLNEVDNKEFNSN